MSYTVFARKYRPKTFADVLGQDHVVRTLQNAVSQQRLAQAYLFVGPRGTGKTSTARIFAKALNCTGGPKVDFDPEESVCQEIAEGRSLDVLEIDGASNNGVEQVRDLREQVGFAPAQGQFRIFYIDEVHMLTTAAFNALLKTLEEPPPHVKFIFATTEAHKILPTILSRCQRFDLRRIPAQIIAEHLLKIADLEKVQLDRLAAHAIAGAADGGMRDAQSMLDQLVAFCGTHIREEDVMHIFGVTSHATVAGLSEKILRLETAAALTQLHEQSEAGKELSKLVSDLIFHFRNVLVYQVDPKVAAQESAPEMLEALESQSKLVASDKLMNLLDQFAEVEAAMRWAPNKRLCFEIGIIKAAQTLNEATLSDVIHALNGALSQAPVSDSMEVRAVPAEPRPPKVSVTEVTVAPETKAVSAPPGPMVDGESLWNAVLADMQEQEALTHAWAAQGVFQSVTGNDFLIAFAPGDAIACESVLRPRMREEIESQLARLSGKPYRLVAKVSDSIAPPKPIMEEPGPVASPAPAKPQPASAPTVTTEEAFRNDPMIKEALDIFDGEIVK